MTDHPAHTLTRPQARRAILAHQGLWPPHARRGKAGLLAHMRRVRCVQYDPLDVVGRNPELVLQARVADFSRLMLNELLYQDRALVDGWDKMMSIYVVEDWPGFAHRHRAMRRRYGHDDRPATEVLPQVRAALAARGPLSSIDLDLDRTVDWSWAPTRIARAALESMYAWGELIVHHKVGTRKVYDFANKHLPPEILSAPDPNGTEARYHDWRVLRRLGGLGLLWDRSGGGWLGIGGLKSAQRKAALARLLERGEVVQVAVEGIDAPFYARRSDWPALKAAATAASPSPEAAILAPLDNLLWDRDMAKALFDFKYVWEVYKPADERRYGYYVLPVLYGDRFVARFEPVRDKERGGLTIEGWWWEEEVEPDAAMQEALRRCMARFAALDTVDAGAVRLGAQAAAVPDLEWLEGLGR